MPSRRHNGGPALLKAEHAASLQASLAEIDAQLRALQQAVDFEVNKRLSRWRNRQHDGSVRFAPSRLAKCPRDRRLLEDATRIFRADAAARRIGQIRTLRAKAERIERSLRQALS